MYIYMSICTFLYYFNARKKITLKKIFSHPIKKDLAPNLPGLGLVKDSLEIVKDPEGLHYLGKLGEKSVHCGSALIDHSGVEAPWCQVSQGTVETPDLQDPCPPVGHIEESQGVETPGLTPPIPVLKNLTPPPRISSTL